MTIYDLLRRLLPGPAWQDYEYAEAIKLIDEIERLNIFGTTARTVTEQHEHDYQPLRFSGYTVQRCTICGKDLNE